LEVVGSDLINKRITTEKNRVKSLDDLENSERLFLLWLLAYSFDENYTPQISYSGEKYNIRIEISKDNNET